MIVMNAKTCAAPTTTHKLGTKQVHLQAWLKRWTQQGLPFTVSRPRPPSRSINTNSCLWRTVALTSSNRLSKVLAVALWSRHDILQTRSWSAPRSNFLKILKRKSKTVSLSSN